MLTLESLYTLLEKKKLFPRGGTEGSMQIDVHISLLTQRNAFMFVL